MAGEKCQVCGGRVVNGRCSLCGMPYRNDEILYHLNEPRDVHYRHASAKVRDMMRQYGQTVDKTAQRGGRVNRSTNMGRNTNAGQQYEYGTECRSASRNPGAKPESKWKSKYRKCSCNCEGRPYRQVTP